jgi:hypothetical protein
MEIGCGQSVGRMTAKMVSNRGARSEAQMPALISTTGGSLAIKHWPGAVAGRSRAGYCAGRITATTVINKILRSIPRDQFSM